MDAFRLGVLIPVFGRVDITRVVLDHYLDIFVPDVEIKYLILSSPDDTDQYTWKRYLRDPRFYFASVPNKPLSDKFNAGINLLYSELKLDAVTVIGSDDLVTADFFSQGASLIRQGYDLASPSNIAFFDSDDHRMFFAHAMNIGAGSFVSTRVLDNFRGEMFVSGRNEGVDFQFVNRCFQYGITKYVKIHVDLNSDCMIVDVKKRGNNVHNYDALNLAFANRSIEIEPRSFFMKYFPESYNKLCYGCHI